MQADIPIFKNSHCKYIYVIIIHDKVLDNGKHKHNYL